MLSSLGRMLMKLENILIPLLKALEKIQYFWKKSTHVTPLNRGSLIKLGEDEDIARKLITLPKKVEDLLSKRLEIVRVINEVQEIRDNCEIQGFIIRIVQLFLPSKKYEMNKLMSSSLVRNQQIIHIHQHSTLVGRIIWIFSGSRFLNSSTLNLPI